MNSIKKSEERNYSYDIIDLNLNAISTSSDQCEIQKRRFEILSKLVSDLFKYRNSRKCIKTISNLIITTLLTFEDNDSVDFYSEGNRMENLDEDFKREGKKLLLGELFKMNNSLPN